MAILKPQYIFWYLHVCVPHWHASMWSLRHMLTEGPPVVWVLRHAALNHSGSSKGESKFSLAPLCFGKTQLELVNLYQNGDMTRLWQVASQTDLTLNLVSDLLLSERILFACDCCD